MRNLGICPDLVFPELPITSSNSAIHYSLHFCIFISQFAIETGSRKLAFCDFSLLKTLLFHIVPAHIFLALTTYTQKSIKISHFSGFLLYFSHEYEESYFSSSSYTKKHTATKSEYHMPLLLQANR